MNDIHAYKSKDRRTKINNERVIDRYAYEPPATPGKMCRNEKVEITIPRC